MNEMGLSGQLNHPLKNFVQLWGVQRILFGGLETLGVVVPSKKIPMIGVGQDLACPQPFDQGVFWCIEFEKLGSFQNIIQDCS